MHMVRDHWKIALFLVAIIIEASAAAKLATMSAAVGKGVSLIVILALLVTLAQGFRQIIDEVTGSDSKSARQARKGARLLAFLERRFMPLMSQVSALMTCSDQGEHLTYVANIEHSVLDESLQVAASDEACRAALFRLNGNGFIPIAYAPGWPVPPEAPQITTGRGMTIKETLDTSNKIYSADVDQERSYRAMAFKCSDECKSFVSVPIRVADQLKGFLHLESNNKNDFDKAAAAVVEALAQVISVAWSTEQLPSATDGGN
jgi:transcriptional regulator with GAF, ATPase, and Fis domain